MPLPATYQNNTSTPLPKADYGIKIAKAGFDALTAADNDLLFNSSWPSVQIVLVQSVVSGDVVAHGLTFPPVAFIIGGNGQTTVMYGQDVDATNVYPRDAGILVVYRVDVSTDIEYPYTATQSINTAYNQDYGIKMVKAGGDIDSNDLRDYVLHSRCGSPLVLAVKTQETVNSVNPSVVQYTSGLGYATLNFGYAGVRSGQLSISGKAMGSNAYIFAPQGGQAYPITYTNGFTAYIDIISNSFFNGNASVVCLRSPMFATTNTVQVTY